MSIYTNFATDDVWIGAELFGPDVVCENGNGSRAIGG
jgi:hypothetical protein